MVLHYDVLNRVTDTTQRLRYNSYIHRDDVERTLP